MIIFTTDNGGAAAGYAFAQASNWPLRGVKASTWEGGIKGVGFIWSPLLDHQNFGTRYPNLMHISDWLPTILDVATRRDKSETEGDDLNVLSSPGNASSKKDTDDHGIETTTPNGVSHWSHFLRSDRSSPPRDEALHFLDDTDGMMSSIRVGDYKLVWGQPEFGYWSDWYGPGEINLKGMGHMLPVPASLNLTEIHERFKDHHPEKDYVETDVTKEFEDDTQYFDVFKGRLDTLTKGWSPNVFSQPSFRLFSFFRILHNSCTRSVYIRVLCLIFSSISPPPHCPATATSATVIGS